MSEQSSMFVSLPFSDLEFKNRRSSVISLMDKNDLDAVVVSSAPNFYYICGMQTQVILGQFSLVVTRDGRGFWIGRHTEMGNAQAFIDAAGWSEIARGIKDEEDTYEVFGATLGALLGGKGRVGFELDARWHSPAGIATISKTAPGLEILNSSGLIESLRVTKSAAEVAYLRAAGKITAAAIRDTVDGLSEAKTDSDLASDLYASLNRHGSGPLPIAPSVVSGLRSALAHTTYANEKIRRGDLINLETGGVVSRYCAPVYRIAMIGEPSDDAKRLHDASRAGLLAGLEKIVPGMTSHDADRVVKEAIAATGLLESSTVRAGYSVGIGFVPSWDEDHIMKLQPNDPRQVRAGMVFHLVPALYKPGLGAVCCSNTIHITDSGAEALVPIEPELLTA